MHYYQFNISDFNNATRHLGRIERSIYRDLIDLYYDTEKPLDADAERLARRIVASDCLTSVEQVLNEFFTLTEQGWVNERCDADIAEYHARHDKAVRAGRASAKARKANKPKGSSDSTPVEQVLSISSTDVQPTINHKLITNNHREGGSPPSTPQPQKKKGGTRLPDDWHLPLDWGNWAVGEGLTADEVRKEGERFKDYWIAKAGKDAAKLDWAATWRNWIRRQKDYKQGKPEDRSDITRHADKTWAEGL